MLAFTECCWGDRVGFRLANAAFQCHVRILSRLPTGWELPGGHRKRMSPLPSRARVSLVLVGSYGRRDVSDPELARALIAREEWALTETWHRFAPMVLVMAERALGSKPEAEDLLQEVFDRLFRRAHTLEDPNCLRSFIYSFAVRALKAQLRYRHLRAWLSFRNPETLVDLQMTTLDVESSDLLRRFYVLLDRLSTRDRLVFLLRRVESMTVGEIATTMGISESTVKRSMAHASSRLSRWIDADPSLAAFGDVEGKAGQGEHDSS